MTGTSNTFIVFPGSSADTGLLRQTSIALMYSGPYTVIQGVVDAFNVSLFKSNYHITKLTQICCHRRSSEVWSVTIALRQQAGEREAFWLEAAAGST